MPSFKGQLLRVANIFFYILLYNENVCVFKAVKKNSIDPKRFHNARKG